MTQANIIHRVEFQIPIQQGNSFIVRFSSTSNCVSIADRNPWFTVDCSSPFPAGAARTRSLTSQKIEMNYTPHHHPPNVIHADDVASPIEIQTTLSTVSSPTRCSHGEIRLISLRTCSLSFSTMLVARSRATLMDCRRATMIL